MPISKRSLQQCFTGKFEFVKVAGTRHDTVALIIDGKKVATTRFSRSHRDIDDTILGKIANQLWVPLGYLKQMHNCTKSRQEYLDYLREKGHLS